MSASMFSTHLSKFLTYLADKASSGESTLPSLNDISQELGMSVALLREEVQVARTLGLVEVKPRTGIKILPYSFASAIKCSLAYGVRVERKYFRQFSELRNHIETSYWYQAVGRLMPEDIKELKDIIQEANRKLASEPIQIPHAEHRNLHLTIYKRLENPFVQGILESYWDFYEAVGLSVYEDQEYLERVWSHHREIVEAISQGDFQSGYQSLVAHMDLLFQRNNKNLKFPFE